MERQIQAFVAELEDPMRPNVCAACLVCLRKNMSSDVKNTTTPMLRTLRTHNHELYQRITQLITVKRTTESRAAANRRLSARLAACTSFVWQREMHAWAVATVKKDDNLLLIVVEFFCEFLDACLRVSSSKLLQAQRFSQHGHWPTSPNDLLPYGAADSLSSLLYWFTVSLDHSTSVVLVSIISACHQDLEPLLTNELNRRLLIKSFCSRIKQAVKYFDAGGPPGVAKISSRFVPQVRIVAVVKVLEHVVEATSSSLPKIQFEPENPSTYMVGYEREIIEALEAAIPLITQDYERARLAMLANVAYATLQIMPVNRSPILKGQFNGIRMKAGDAYGVLYNFLLRIRETRSCTAPGCKRDEHGLGRKLNQCAGCGIFNYCSKDCQRADWRFADRPHKSICSRLKKIEPILRGYPNKMDFSRELKAIGITLEDVAIILDCLEDGKQFFRVYQGLPLAQRIEKEVRLLTFFNTLQASSNIIDVLRNPEMMEIASEFGGNKFIADMNLGMNLPYRMDLPY